jgi:hypothetical protein
MMLKIILGGELVLELDLDLDGRLDTAWWSWKGLTIAEAIVGRA